MSALRSLTTITLLLPALAACSPLSGKEPPEIAVWVPYAEAGFATVHRSTSYVVQHSDDTDLLIYEVEEHFPSGETASRLTWLIQVASGAPLEKPLDLGVEGGPTSGWLVEQIAGKPTHAAPLRGTITIAQRTAEAVSAVVNVYAVTSDPSGGEVTGGRVRLARKLEWSRETRQAIGSKEPETRGGITHEEQESGTAKQLK